MDSACVGNKVSGAAFSAIGSILQDRYPDIAFQLHFVPFAPFIFRKNPDESWNAVRSDGEKEYCLHGASIDKEMARFFKDRHLEDVEIFYLYGIGLGYHYAALKPWLEDKPGRLLIIIEEDLGAIAACLESEYGEEILLHPQVHIRLASCAEEISILMKGCIADFPSERVEIAAIEHYARRKKGKFRSLKMQLYRFTAVSHALMTEVIYSHKLLSNLMRNIVKWPGSFFANRLKDQFKGIPAIICGAGPSLAKTFEDLKAIDDRALIIAGGSTIAALSNQGIIPHLGLAMDPNPEEFDRLKASSSYEMPLIFATRLEARVFNTCNGARGYLCTDTGGPCEAHFEKALQIEEPPIGPELGAEAFSVTTLCIALAVEMGCNPIILNGIDLAYTGMQRYASGVLPSSQIFMDEAKQMKCASERLVRKKDIFGNPVHSLVKWIMESECISAYAAVHPECRFINATQGGIGFPAIPNLALHNIPELHEQAAYDLKAMLHALFQNHPMHTVSLEKIVQEIDALSLSLSSCEQIVDQILAEIQRAEGDAHIAWPTSKMTILEIDFQEERAFTCCFLTLGPALDRLLNRAHYLSPLLSEDEKRRIGLERQKLKWIQFKERVQCEKEFFCAMREEFS